MWEGGEANVVYDIMGETDGRLASFPRRQGCTSSAWWAKRENGESEEGGKVG